MSYFFSEIKNRLGGSSRGSPTMPPAECSKSQPMESLSRSFMATNDIPSTMPAHPGLLPVWLNPDYGKKIIKGNLVTLSAKPRTVDDGEWLAFQAVEHYRLLSHFLKVVVEKEDDGSFICKCDRMSAGSTSYVWSGDRPLPIQVSARQYISFAQQWISSKIDDVKLFPTNLDTVSFGQRTQSENFNNESTTVAAQWIGKQSGFPKEFAELCQTIFIHMFRIYAHLYWEHFVDPFFHLNLEKELNSCFAHFILTATGLEMVPSHEIKPMQDLIDLLATNGSFPRDSRAYQLASRR